MTLSNNSGTNTTSVNVKVLDSPGPPADFMATNVTKESVTVTWKPPDIDGGSNVKNYILERREATKKAWSTVETACQRTTYKFTNLIEGCSYVFR